MAEQRTDIRFRTVGATQVQSEIQGIGLAGARGFETLSQATQQSTRRLAEVDRGIKVVGRSFTQAARSAAGLAAGIAGVTTASQALVSGATAAIDFEAGLANVSTLVDTSTVSIAGLRQELLELPAVLGTATELSQALYQTLSAGVEPAAAVQFVGDAARFATAGITEASTAVDVLTTIISAYGLEASDAARVSDVLFRTIELGKTNAEELGTTLGRVIPFAETLGVSLEEVGAAIATLTATRDTAEAVTALRGTFAAFINQAERFREIGVDIIGVIRERGLRGALEELADATQGNITAVRQFVPDIEALGAVLGLVGAQADDFAEKLVRFEDTAGATLAAFAKQTETTRSGFAELTGEVDRFVQTIGPPFLQRLNQASRSLAEFLRGLRSTVFNQSAEGGTPIEQTEQQIDRLLQRQERLGRLLSSSRRVARDVREDAARALAETTAELVFLESILLDGVEAGERLNRTLADTGSQTKEIGQQTRQTAADRRKAAAEATRAAQQQLVLEEAVAEALKAQARETREAAAARRELNIQIRDIVEGTPVLDLPPGVTDGITQSFDNIRDQQRQLALDVANDIAQSTGQIFADMEQGVSAGFAVLRSGIVSDLAGIAQQAADLGLGGPGLAAAAPVIGAVGAGLNLGLTFSQVAQQGGLPAGAANVLGLGLGGASAGFLIGGPFGAAIGAGAGLLTGGLLEAFRSSSNQGLSIGPAGAFGTQIGGPFGGSLAGDDLSDFVFLLRELDTELANLIDPRRLPAVSQQLADIGATVFDFGSNIGGGNIADVIVSRANAIIQAGFGIANVFEGINTGSIDAVLARLDEFQRTVAAIEIATAEPLSAVEQAIKNTNDEFETLIRQAEEFGLATSDLVRAQRRAIETIREEEAARNQAIRNAQLQPLQQFLSNLAAGPGSPFSATQVLANAQQVFQSALRGDESTAVVSAAQNLLTAGREVFASGGAFFDLLDVVRAQVGGFAASIAADPASQLADISNEIQSQTDETIARLEAIIETLVEGNAQSQRVSALLERLTATLQA